MKNISILFLVFLMFSCSDDNMSEKKEYMSEEKEVRLSANLVYKDCETNGSPAGADGLKTWCWTRDLANEISYSVYHFFRIYN